MAESVFQPKENWLFAKVAILKETFKEHLHVPVGMFLLHVRRMPFLPQR